MQFSHEDAFVCIEADTAKRLVFERSLRYIPYFDDYGSNWKGHNRHTTACSFGNLCSSHHVVWPGKGHLIDLILSSIRDQSLPDDISEHDIIDLKKDFKKLGLDQLYWETQLVYRLRQAKKASKYTQNESKATLALGDALWTIDQHHLAFQEWCKGWTLQKEGDFSLHSRKNLYKDLCGRAFSSRNSDEGRGFAFMHLAALEALSSEHKGGNKCDLRWRQALRFLPDLVSIDIQPIDEVFRDKVMVLGSIKESLPRMDKDCIKSKFTILELKSRDSAESISLKVNARGTIMNVTIIDVNMYRKSGMSLLIDNQSHRDNENIPFLDVDPDTFRHIAKMLKHGALPTDLQSDQIGRIRQEAEYLGFDNIIAECNTFYEILQGMLSKNKTIEAMSHLLLGDILHHNQLDEEAYLYWKKAYTLTSISKLTIAIRQRRQQVAMSNKDRAMLYLHLAELTAMEKGADEALNYANKASQLNGSNAMIQRFLITALMSAGKYDAAYNILHPLTKKILDEEVDVLDLFEELRIAYTGCTDMATFICGFAHQSLAFDNLGRIRTCTIFLKVYPQSNFMQGKLASILSFSNDFVNDEVEEEESATRYKEAHESLLNAIKSHPINVTAMIQFGQYLLYDIQDYDNAELIVQLALDHFSRHPATHQMHSQLLLIQKLPKEALKASQRAMQKSTEHFGSDWVSVAIAAEEANDLELAIEARISALQCPFTSSDLHSSCILKLYRLGKHQEAFTAWKSLLADVPFNIRARVDYARALLTEFQVEEALEETSIALEHDPEDRMDATSILIEALCLMGEVAIAEKTLNATQRPLESTPISLVVALATGWFEQTAISDDEDSHEQFISKAETLLEHALERDNTYFNAWHLKIRILYGQNKFEEALKCCEKADECQMDHIMTQRLRLHIMYAQNRYQEVIDYYRKIEHCGVIDMDTLIFAESHICIDVPDVAVEILKKIKTPLKRAYELIIDYYTDQKRWTEVIEIASTASNHFEKEASFTEAIFHAHFEMKQDELAREAAQEAFKKDSSCTRILNNYSMILRRCSLFLESEKYAKRSIAIEPTYFGFFQLAKTSYQLKKYVEAERALIQARKFQKSFEIYQIWIDVKNALNDSKGEIWACSLYLKLMKSDADIWLRLGRLLKEIDGKKAGRCFRKVLGIPDVRTEVVVEALLDLIKICRNEHRYLVALSYAREAVLKAPIDVFANEALGNVLEDWGADISASEQWIQSTTITEQSWPHARAGISLINAPDRKNARKYLEYAMKINQEEIKYSTKWINLLDLLESSPEEEEGKLSLARAIDKMDETRKFSDPSSLIKDHWLTAKILLDMSRHGMNGWQINWPMKSSEVFDSAQIKNLCFALRRREVHQDVIISILEHSIQQNHNDINILKVYTGQMILMSQYDRAVQAIKNFYFDLKIENIMRLENEADASAVISSMTLCMFDIGDWHEAFQLSRRNMRFSKVRCSRTIGEMSASLYLDNQRRLGDATVLEAFASLQGLTVPTKDSDCFMIGNMVKSSYFSVEADVRVACAERCIDLLCEDAFDDSDFVEALRLNGRLEDAMSVVETALTLPRWRNDIVLHQEYCALLIQMREA